MKKILIVDDEKMFGDMMKMVLERDGEYDVEVLLSGKEIMAHLHSFVPDLILLDLLMPGIGGLEVVQMLNGDPIGAKTPVIILSALEKEADKLQAFKLGVVDYLVKPVEVKDVLRAIASALKLS